MHLWTLKRVTGHRLLTLAVPFCTLHLKSGHAYNLKLCSQCSMEHCAETDKQPHLLTQFSIRSRLLCLGAAGLLGGLDCNELAHRQVTSRCELEVFAHVSHGGLLQLIVTRAAV